MREEYLAPMGMSVHALSQALRALAKRLHEVVKERRSITFPQTLMPFALSLSKGTTLRLARYFGTYAQSWLNLQMSYELKIAEAGLQVRIKREVEKRAV